MKKYFLFIFLLSILLVGRAQDLHFSQYLNSPLTLNPASAGVFDGTMRAIANYKTQWHQVTTPFKTYAFSFDGGLLKGKWRNGYIGAGITIIKDIAGDSKMGTTQANLSLSSVLKVSERTHLSAGIQAGLGQRSITVAGLQWDSQYNGFYYDSGVASNEQFASSNFVFQDYSVGALYSYQKGEMYSTANDATSAQIGIAAFHLNKPSMSFAGGSDRLYSKYVVHGNLYKGLKNTNISVLPTAVVYLQGKSKEILAGMLVKYNLQDASKYTGNIKASAVFLGGYYRFGDALVICSQLELDKCLLGLSYDVNMSGLTTVSKGLGGLEVSLRYIFNTNTGNISKMGHSKNLNK